MSYSCEVRGVSVGGSRQIMQGHVAIIRTSAVAPGWEATGGPTERPVFYKIIQTVLCGDGVCGVGVGSG